jgi:hypothetical protein
MRPYAEKLQTILGNERELDSSEGKYSRNAK